MTVSHLDPFTPPRPRRSWIANLFRREEVEASPPDGVAESLVQAKIYEALLPFHAKQQGRMLRNVAEMLKDWHAYHDPEWRRADFEDAAFGDAET